MKRRVTNLRQKIEKAEYKIAQYAETRHHQRDAYKLEEKLKEKKILLNILKLDKFLNFLVIWQKLNAVSKWYSTISRIQFQDPRYKKYPKIIIRFQTEKFLNSLLKSSKSKIYPQKISQTAS